MVFDRLWSAVAAVVVPASVLGWGRLTASWRTLEQFWREVDEWEAQWD